MQTFKKGQSVLASLRWLFNDVGRHPYPERFIRCTYMRRRGDEHQVDCPQVVTGGRPLLVGDSDLIDDSPMAIRRRRLQRQAVRVAQEMRFGGRAIAKARVRSAYDALSERKRKAVDACMAGQLGTQCRGLRTRDGSWRWHVMPTWVISDFSRAIAQAQLGVLPRSPALNEAGL